MSVAIITASRYSHLHNPCMQGLWVCGVDICQYELIEVSVTIISGEGAILYAWC